MSVFRRGRKWVAQAYDPATGRMRQLGTFDTNREARAAEARGYERRVAKAETVRSFVDRWTRDYPRPADSTNKHNAERVSTFADTFADTRLDRISRQDARAWSLEHPATHSALRAMFTDALRDDLVTNNPFADLGINKKTSKRKIEPGWMTVEDVAHLATTAHLVHQPLTAQIVGNAILVAAYTGIRPGELFALEHGDVRGDELLITRAVRSNTKTVGTPKNGKPRVIVLPELAAEAIATTPRLHDTIVFTSPRGRMLYQSSWHGLWNPVRCAAGRPSMHFYELRHWAATHLLELGLSPADVAVQMGHSDGGVLVQTLYGHPSEDNARDRIKNATSKPQPDHSNTHRRAQ